MNTTIKIGMICLICMAVMMSGCMESNDNAPDGNVLYHIDLILDPHSGPGVMEVSLNEDSTATITTIKGTSDTIEVGTWQFYRESDDHTMYDIITDDTELRVALQNDGHAIAYIYEGGFTKCGEPFYGVWEQMGEESTTDDESTDDESSSITSDIIGSITGGESDDLPITLFMDLAPLYDSTEEDIIRITLSTDGTAEFCGGRMRPQDCEDGTWEKRGSSGREYDTTSDVFSDIHITILDDGAAEFRSDGYVLDGMWKPGIDTSMG